PCSPLVPYTTLFRSLVAELAAVVVDPLHHVTAPGADMEGAAGVENAFFKGTREGGGIVVALDRIGVRMSIQMHGHQIRISLVESAHLRQRDGSVAPEGDGDGTTGKRHLHRRFYGGIGGFEVPADHPGVAEIDNL